MSPPDFKATSILTEHLGYAPLSLVDDVINAVNELMYKCTAALEEFLYQRETKFKKQQNDEELKENERLINSDDVILDINAVKKDEDEKLKNKFIIPEDEIELGTAALESFLEHKVDMNFDRFELYTLRNLLVIPKDLANSGFIRLTHHKNLAFHSKQDTLSESLQLDKDISELQLEISNHLHIRKLLKIQLTRANRTLKLLNKYMNSLGFLILKSSSESSSTKNTNTSLSKEAEQALKVISPLGETLYFLQSQVTEMVKVIENLQIKFNTSASDGGLKGLEINKSQRDVFLDEATNRIFHKLQIPIDSYTTVDGDKDDDEDLSNSNIGSVSRSEIELLKNDRSEKEVENIKQIVEKKMEL